MTSFRAVPITLADANEFVAALHRHNGRLPSARFSIAAIDPLDGIVHGVAIAGRPKTRFHDDGYTLEVNRVCSDGSWNCCSFLYGCCIRAAKALGYVRAITYTLESEPGSSLRGAGWVAVADVPGSSTGWVRKGNLRRNGGTGSHNHGPKVRWELSWSKAPPRPMWSVGARADQLALAVDGHPEDGRA